MHIDWTRCDGRGLCTELLPEVLGRDAWGYPMARRSDPAGRSDPVIPGELVETAADAVALCPLQALQLHRREVPR
ncbi:ferredoxin [Pseudolysinimonas sp.]|uniref:ferredoxin n=1 Tax=Pseudolysinimonas sp. TaxID=2680009 RepID=UPI003F8208C5